MRLREREPQAGQPALLDLPGGGGGNLEILRQQGQAYLAAGRDATQRALSSDSQSFNRALRQTIGQ